MTKTVLEAKHAEAQAASVKEYLHRQQIQQQLAQWQQQAALSDQRLLTLDGQIEAYAALLALPDDTKEPHGD